MEFINVGRDHKTWTIETESLSDRSLERAIRAERALMSGIITFHWTDDGTEAAVCVGPFDRIVGRLRVTGGRREPAIIL